MSNVASKCVEEKLREELLREMAIEDLNTRNLFSSKGVCS